MWNQSHKSLIKYANRNNGILISDVPDALLTQQSSGRRPRLLGRGAGFQEEVLDSRRKSLIPGRPKVVLRASPPPSPQEDAGGAFQVRDMQKQAPPTTDRPAH